MTHITTLAETCNYFLRFAASVEDNADEDDTPYGYDQAAHFLKRLDPEAKAFTFQCLPDSDKAKTKPIILHGTLQQHWRTLLAQNDKGSGVFVTINETDLKGRTAKNIKRVRALFADLDGAPLEPVITSKPKPHIVVNSSPGKFHIYWLVSDVKLDAFGDKQKSLIERFDGDPAVHDLPRIMRLPGFLHRKGEPFLSRIISTHSAPAYSASDFSNDLSDASDGEVRNPFEAYVEENKSETQKLNDRALANLSAWVPEIFPKAKRNKKGIYRISSADLGRENEEDLSISPKGVKDFGLHDLDDPRQGRRTPVQLVMEHKFGVSVEEIARHEVDGDVFAQACDWLRERLPSDDEPEAKDHEQTVDGQKAKGKAQTSAVIVRASEVKMREKEWLWEGHLLRGALELLTGLPGLGKSQVQIHLLACATAGLVWPNGARAIEPVDVIMVTAEDAIDTEVVPRLMAAGADLDRIHILKCIKTDKAQRQFLLADDLAKLEQAVAEIGNVGLICLDPITAYMGGKMDSHKATEVRSQLGPLKDFAERTNVALSAITHPAKNAGTKAIDHFIGSQAFVAAARVGHACFRGN